MGGKVHLVLWQFQGGVNLQIYLGKSEHELLFLYALVFPYIFLLFDCFEWALIDHGKVEFTQCSGSFNWGG